jgi:Cyclopropane fatty acid synthase and related methyltransferases
MEELKQLLNEIVNVDLLSIVISDSKNKDEISKIKIRPILIKNNIIYQASLQKKEKVYHENHEKFELIKEILNWLETYFKQMQIETKNLSGTVLISKKGKVTIKTKAAAVKKTIALAHNKKKEYILEEDILVPFLVDLGIMTKEGKIVNAKYDKYRQINRFLEFIEDILPHLSVDREVSILDFGCGKSYLTFALYYYLKELKAYDVRVIGLDLKEDVIEKCNHLATQYGYEKLEFYVGDIASYNGKKNVDMVVTLHACDTATDYAIQKAVEYDAKVILSVPCCQHELNGQLACETLDSVLKYGLLKERIAALITDGLRASLLEQAGYAVQILEFIALEHTSKNILIRAVKTGKKARNKKELSKCMEFLGTQPKLETLLGFEREQGDKICGE